MADIPFIRTRIGLSDEDGARAGVALTDGQRRTFLGQVGFAFTTEKGEYIDESPNLLVAEAPDGAISGFLLLEWWAGRPEGVGRVASAMLVHIEKGSKPKVVTTALFETARGLVGEGALCGIRMDLHRVRTDLAILEGIRAAGFSDDFITLYHGTTGREHLPPTRRERVAIWWSRWGSAMIVTTFFVVFGLLAWSGR